MILISEFGFVQLDNLLVFSCIILVPLRYFVVWFRIWVYWVGGTIPGFQWVYICKLVDYNLLPIPPVTRWWQLKYVLCSPRKLGKMNPFWPVFFQWGWFNHQLLVLPLLRYPMTGRVWTRHRSGDASTSRRSGSHVQVQGNSNDSSRQTVGGHRPETRRIARKDVFLLARRFCGNPQNVLFENWKVWMLMYSFRFNHSYW